MARGHHTETGTPLKRGGQGAVEAILALPVFLILVCLIFQLFFIGLAKIQLQYAAFCASRAGAVHSADMAVIRQTVKRILAVSAGLFPLTDGACKVEILHQREDGPKREPSGEEPAREALSVRVHWHYPLMIPLPWINSSGKNPTGFRGKSTIHLQASWAMPVFAPMSWEENHGKGEER